MTGATTIPDKYQQKMDARRRPLGGHHAKPRVFRIVPGAVCESQSEEQLDVRSKTGLTDEPQPHPAVMPTVMRGEPGIPVDNVGDKITASHESCERILPAPVQASAPGMFTPSTKESPHSYLPGNAPTAPLLHPVRTESGFGIANSLQQEKQMHSVSGLPSKYAAKVQARRRPTGKHRPKQRPFTIQAVPLSGSADSSTGEVDSDGEGSNVPVTSTSDHEPDDPVLAEYQFCPEDILPQTPGPSPEAVDAHLEERRVADTGAPNSPRLPRMSLGGQLLAMNTEKIIGRKSTGGDLSPIRAIVSHSEHEQLTRDLSKQLSRLSLGSTVGRLEEGDELDREHDARAYQEPVIRRPLPERSRVTSSEPSDDHLPESEQALPLRTIPQQGYSTLRDETCMVPGPTEQMPPPTKLKPRKSVHFSPIPKEQHKQLPSSQLLSSSRSELEQRQRKSSIWSVGCDADESMGNFGDVSAVTSEDLSYESDEGHTSEHSTREMSYSFAQSDVSDNVLDGLLYEPTDKGDVEEQAYRPYTRRKSESGLIRLDLYPTERNAVTRMEDWDVSLPPDAWAGPLHEDDADDDQEETDVSTIVDTSATPIINLINMPKRGDAFVMDNDPDLSLVAPSPIPIGKGRPVQKAIAEVPLSRPSHVGRNAETPPRQPITKSAPKARVSLETTDRVDTSRSKHRPSSAVGASEDSLAGATRLAELYDDPLSESENYEDYPQTNADNSHDFRSPQTPSLNPVPKTPNRTASHPPLAGIQNSPISPPRHMQEVSPPLSKKKTKGFAKLKDRKQQPMHTPVTKVAAQVDTPVTDGVPTPPRRATRAACRAKGIKPVVKLYWGGPTIATYERIKQQDTAVRNPLKDLRENRLKAAAAIDDDDAILKKPKAQKGKEKVRVVDSDED
ncbi:hypothetical protein BC832DRAFT_562133 [Gaertneriomyces semiglobifer]|nr:hypothetical protein BC832DRAFT_562133 [Gaertneriomyces semiglobifer]